MPRASHLLLESATPFDQGCLVVREMEHVLDRIIALDKYATTNGRDDYFERELRGIFSVSRHVIECAKL
jgi:hypothetical protein